VSKPCTTKRHQVTRYLPDVGIVQGRPSRLPPARMARAVESVRSALRRVSFKMLPPAASVLDMTMGFATGQTILAAVKLGIADVLATGPLTAAQVAERIDADPVATQRLLRALAMQSIFSERRDGRFEMTSLAQALRSDSPMSIRPLLLMLGHPLYWEHWGCLAESVRAGRTSVEMNYGVPLFGLLDQEPEIAQVFNDAMTCASAMTIPPILAVCDFGVADTIVDVGGGNGQLLAAALAAVPGARGVLFERQALEPSARAIVEAAGVATRFEFEAGSFFDSVPTGGDVYLLKHVVHDWDDDRAGEILRTVRDSMRPTASLLLIECVIPTRNKAHFGKYLDLDMLIFAGGRERTEREFSDLLHHNGFTLRRVIPTVTHVSIIEAVPS
jgi:O-methyltransferase/methyltransferase family protein